MPSAPSGTPVSFASARMRRDRHGRGLRGPLLPPSAPAWRSRAQRFDELVIAAAANLTRRQPQVAQVQFAVEEIPPSDPAPWEHSVVLGRAFAAEPRAGLPARIVIYRRPVESRAQNQRELNDLVMQVLAQQVASVLHCNPEDLLGR